MPRRPTLRKHGNYWFTQAGGGSGTYFGKVGEVTYGDAKKEFAKYLDSLSTITIRSDAVAVLIDNFLDACKDHRALRSYKERKLHLERFANFRCGPQIVGELAAHSIRAEHLTKFLEHAQTQFELDAISVHKHAVSITAAFNWGSGRARLKNPLPCLPAGFRPFGGVERWKAPPNELHEDELPTVDEINALLKWADTDVGPIYENGRWRTRRPEERRHDDDNPYRGFADLLMLYYSTGARTGELADCKVRDVMHGSRQIVLGKHKRSASMRDAATRRLTLNDKAYAIVKKWCSGKKPDDPLFTDPPQDDQPGKAARHGRQWNRLTAAYRFNRVRKLAEVRDDITIYSLRHLWISEALMSGVDISTTAKMAGTSVSMIEKVYGHFRAEHVQEAQRRLDTARNDKVMQPA